MPVDELADLRRRRQPAGDVDARHHARRRDDRRLARPRPRPGGRHGARPAARRIGGARVFVELSDGEMQEGSTWEAAMSAAHFRLDNLVALIDCNGIQADGAIVLDMEPVADKWRAFGWETQRDRRQRHGRDRRRADAARAAATAGRRRSCCARCPARACRRIEKREKAHFVRVDAARMGRAHRRVRGATDEPWLSRPHARDGRRTRRRRRPRRRVDAPFGKALAALGRDAAGDRRADRRPRQIHRHPSRSATPSPTASSMSAWPSRT